jgi:alpha-1,2-mannosyltransferase
MSVTASVGEVQPRPGGWLDRGMIGRLAALLFAFQLAGLLFIVAGTHGLITPLDHPVTTDFVSFYAAGALADAGTPQLAYDQAAHRAAEEAATAPGVEYRFFNYPPVFLLLCAALAHLPYLAAFLLFEAATLGLFLAVACRIADDCSPTAIVVLLAFPMLYWTLGLGQNAFLTAGLFGAATLLIERRPLAAGLLFGAISYKPHFGLLIPVALAAGGHWRAFGAATASVAALVLVSVALFGIDTWHGFVSAITASPQTYQSGRIVFDGFVSPFGAVRLLGGSPPLAYGVQAVAALIAAGAVFVAWRRGLSLPVRAAILASGTLVAVPVALLYELMLGAIAGAWLVRADPAANKVPLALLLVALLPARSLSEALQIPIFPVIAVALFAITLWRAWQEMTATSQAV